MRIEWLRNILLLDKNFFCYNDQFIYLLLFKEIFHQMSYTYHRGNPIIQSYMTIQG
ncbi:hypothetical protein pb186bvf_014725 [Paramecium bursaria]